MSIIIIDYGMGNVGSIANMIKKVGGTSIITSSIQDINNAEKIILPGVGAFDNGMKNIVNSGLIEVLNKKVLEDKIPILGICLGMQLMTLSSDEGVEKGLGWVKATTNKFDFTKITEKLRIPHMGWNTVTQQKNHPLIQNMELENSRFYFVHSYFVTCNLQQDVLLTCHYGLEFVAAFQKENIMGVQFHPEKSHKFGMQLMRNFLSI